MPFQTLSELASSRRSTASGAEPASMVFKAEVVFEGFGTPRRDAAVSVFRDGGHLVITDIGPAAELVGRHPGATVFDAGVCITPAPVNAHTHLDLSDMAYTPGSYEDFIGAVVLHARTGSRGLPAARRGVAELKASGVTTVGDVVTDPAVMEALLRDPELKGVAYWEVIGPAAADAEERFQASVEAIGRFRELERPGGVRVGVAPHTPHTVSERLLRSVTAWARRERVPVAIHVAETPAERRLHLSGDGPLAASLAAMGFPFAATGVSPVRYLADLGVLEGGPTLVHMVAVDDADVGLVQASGCSVVHCPRSNDALGSGRFPWELYARHGVDVALGTDSRGSSPDLDLVEEALFAVHLHGERVGPRALARAAVKGGHRALGMTPPRVVRGMPASSLGAWVSSTRHRPERHPT